MVRKYQSNLKVLKHSSTNTKYKAEFIEKMVLEYVNSNDCFLDVASRNGIKSAFLLSSWYHVYKEQGLEGLRNMANKPRKRKTAKQT